MTDSPLFWLISTIFWLLVMSFYSTQEMASISFNRLRLEYYLKQNETFAVWLTRLLENPTKLFSTTLIGVNCALMAGSESSRRFFETAGFSPNIAPLVQIPVVLLFGELVPMFAARIHTEHMSRLGIPLLYWSAKILAPIISCVDFFFNKISRYTGKKEAMHAVHFLSREELQKLVEEHESGLVSKQDEHFNEIISNLFSLRAKKAFELMEPLEVIPKVSAHAQVSAVRSLMERSKEKFALVYHKVETKILGVVFPQDLVQESDTKKVDDCMQAPCFVAVDTGALELISELFEDKLTLAIVLDSKAQACGVITMDTLFDELFGSEAGLETGKSQYLTYLEKTFPGEMKIQEMNDTYGLKLHAPGCETFDELIQQTLGRNPVPGDTLFIDPIEITVKETSLFKAKTILIRTRERT